MTALNFIKPPSRIEHYATRDEWLSARKVDSRTGYLGSTDVAAILGWSTYATAWDVWAAHRATHLDAVDTTEPEETPDLLARGLVMEPLLWARYRQRYGLEVIEPGHIRVKRGRFAVSPDAFVADPMLGWGVGEGKTVQWSQAHWVPREDVVIHGLDSCTSWPMPRAYLAQCLAMVIATGLPFCDLFVAVVVECDDQRCVIATDEYPSVPPHAVVRVARIRVIPTEDDLVALKTRLGEWVKRHIIDGEEPPLDDSRACFLHQLGEDPASRTTRREATRAEASIIEDILKEGDVEKAAKTQKNTSRARLVKEMGGMKSVFVETDSGKRITATISTNGRLTVREPKA